MVLITGYQKREAEEREFFLLELEGEIEIVISQKTGLPYATTRKTFMSTTFNEVTCKALVGKELPGVISKVEVDPYEYIVPGTDEVKILGHKYMYLADEKQTTEQAVFS